MKKIFTIFCLILQLGIPVFARYKPIPEDINNQNIYYLNMLDKKFTCYNNNCYDFSSFQYNRFTKTSRINMIVDLMNWNMHQEYQSPYNDGYISHLLFTTKLHNNHLSIKCKGFVTGNVAVEHKNGKAYSAYQNTVAIHKNMPTTIKNIKEFEKTFYNWIDVDSVLKLLKAR